MRRLISPPDRLISKYVSLGDVVADLGCGSGYHALAIANKVGDGGKVYAADSDPKSIDALTKKINAGHYRSVIEPHLASASELPFIPDSSVDFVLAHGVLCCMVDHDGAVREIKRILKLDGDAYLSIEKTLRRKDPRAVRRHEWQSILKRFTILEEGDTLISRWAHVATNESPLGRVKHDQLLDFDSEGA